MRRGSRLEAVLREHGGGKADVGEAGDDSRGAVEVGRAGNGRLVKKGLRFRQKHDGRSGRRSSGGRGWERGGWGGSCAFGVRSVALGGGGWVDCGMESIGGEAGGRRGICCGGAVVGRKKDGQRQVGVG